MRRYPAVATLLAIIWLIVPRPILEAQPTEHPDRRYLALGTFRLESGTVLPAARLAYATRGMPDAQRSNVVLLPSAYGSGHHGYDYLLGPGRALDTTRYFVVLTELFGNGASSSPGNSSPPFDRGRFPIGALRSGGGHPPDNAFIDREIRAFLRGGTSSSPPSGREPGRLGRR